MTARYDGIPLYGVAPAADSSTTNAGARMAASGGRNGPCHPAMKATRAERSSHVSFQNAGPSSRLSFTRLCIRG